MAAGQEGAEEGAPNRAATEFEEGDGSRTSRPPDPAAAATGRAQGRRIWPAPASPAAQPSASAAAIEGHWRREQERAECRAPQLRRYARDRARMLGGAAAVPGQSGGTHWPWPEPASNLAARRPRVGGAQPSGEVARVAARGGRPRRRSLPTGSGRCRRSFRRSRHGAGTAMDSGMGRRAASGGRPRAAGRRGCRGQGLLDRPPTPTLPRPVRLRSPRTHPDCSGVRWALAPSYCLSGWAAALIQLHFLVSPCSSSARVGRAKVAGVARAVGRAGARAA